MDQKHDYKVKYEKGKIHVIYLLIIAVILAIIGISLALGGNDDALAQISMASTVSSIILSSIAIFMSISGENKLNYTHDKLVETSDKMSEITANIERANSEINQKILKIDDIFDRLERIGQSVDNVEKEVVNRTLNIQENSTVDISDDTIWNVYNHMINVTDEDNMIVKITKETMAYFLIYRSKDCTFDADKLDMYLKSVISDTETFSTGLAVGLICVFTAMGLARAKTLKYFEEKIALSEEKRNEIEKFL